MKKGFKIICIIIAVLLTIGIIFFVVNYNKLITLANEKIYQEENDNMKETMEAIVVKVYPSGLLIMGKENTNDLYHIGFTDEGNIGFKQGQEILVYFNGMIMDTYPAQIGNIGKIKIIKEKSDVEIPNKIIKYAYTSKENVNVTINELTRKSISITIQDTNELPYEYSNSYTIYEKVKNKDYIGVGQKIGEDTEDSTSGFTRNRDRIYMARSRKTFRHNK